MAATTPATKSQMVRSLGAPVKSEEFRQAGAQGSGGLHPKDDQHHTNDQQGNANDALHPLSSCAWRQ